MTWKTTIALSVAGILAVVLGKMSGGILAAVYGIRKVIIISLVIAAISYLFSAQAFFGIIALYTFNMTMPVTLYH